MTKRFHKGDWSNNICEVYDDKDYIGGVQLDCADEFISLLNSLNEENKQLRQYKDAIFNWDSSKIIRVNMNTGEVDLVDKVMMND